MLRVDFIALRAVKCFKGINGGGEVGVGVRLQITSSEKKTVRDGAKRLSCNISAFISDG